MLSIYLSYFISHITEQIISIGLLCITFFSFIIYLPRFFKNYKYNAKIDYLKIFKDLIFIPISFLIGFFLIFRVIPDNYWCGWDPWINAPVANLILQKGLNPIELTKCIGSQISIPGFYYFFATVKEYTGLNYYIINRLGGPIIAGMISTITYLIVKRIEGKIFGILTAFFLFLNPFFVHRFSMTLRENFAYIIFLTIILLIVINQKFINNFSIKKSYSFIMGLFLFILFTYQLLTASIIYLLIFIELFFFIINKNKSKFIELITPISLFFIIIFFQYAETIISKINWTIQNWILIDIKILILFSFFLLIMIIIFIYYYKKLSYIKSVEITTIFKISIIILIIILIIGASNSIIYPREFNILGSYNPNIILGNFAISIIPLAIIGIISAIKYSINNIILYLSFILIILLNITNLNIAFPLFRLIIYISWILSYFASKGIKLLFNYPINYEINFPKLRIHISKFYPFLFIAIMLISPNIFTDIYNSKQKWSYYDQKDIDSGIAFANILSENDIVIPQYFTFNLLNYVGIDPNKIIHDEILYEIHDPQNFSRIILSIKPNASRAIVFLIKKWIGRKEFISPSTEMLELYGEKNEIGNVLFYIFYLPFILKERVSITSPIIVKKQSGSQWISVNLTGINLTQAHSITIHIINNASSKNFFIQIYDINNNSTERIIFKLQPNSATYQIPIYILKESINLSYPSKLVMCFSWYNPSEINLIIDSIKILTSENRSES